ncbi:hypothetical protein BC938DRAFT_479338 [Jimgerdemannia flammicorona]|uniref:PAN2-PAN3 deadenylation complex subunit PAN3 n=1 Tax=Jimgerdemannia flammicorona TaxID=994334 RepID=A0A433QXW3_9FUNG|nr:hypothetical protein BC938DRAFT_479338 [Jimgerdemannia flammicorona]
MFIRNWAFLPAHTPPLPPTFDLTDTMASPFVLPSQATNAIPIVAPTAEEKPASKGATPVKNNSSSKRTMKGRDAMRASPIYRFIVPDADNLFFKNRPPRTSQNKSSPQNSPEIKGKLRVNSPVFKPSSLTSAVSPESVNAPVFVPKMNQGGGGTPRCVSTFDPNIAFYPSQSQQASPFLVPQGNIPTGGGSGVPSSPTPQSPQPRYSVTNMYAGNQMDQYYYGNSHVFGHQPLQYHLYSTPLPHVSNLHPHQKTIHGFFMPDNLREELLEKNEAVLRTANAQELNLPSELHVYHSLYPLDEHQEKSPKVFGYPTSVYKAVCTVDGRTYALRRIEGFRLTNEVAMSTIESWRRIRHANIVSIREAFTTKTFGDHSVVFVYDYHPCSSTLFNKYFSIQAQSSGLTPSQPPGGNVNIPEKTLWSFITQLTSSLKTIHSAGLAARVIEPSKILLTSKNRIRLNCCGIFDMLQYDGGQNVARFQQEDLLAFGKLVIALACNSLASITQLPKSFEYISRHYSAELKNVVLCLLSKPMPTKTIDEVVTLIGPRILHEINSAHHYNDFLENELSRELENGRLVRLLCKMGFINERPEFDMDPSWSETGDRYLIKLFRDYVFHQVDENGVPVVDMVHVLTCMNKLDAGLDEKIMLMSRDEQSCLIVSYKEIKNCIIASFRDLSSGRK